MMIFPRKKKKHIGFLLGCLWYYIKSIDNVKRFTEATDLLVSICVDLGIDWNLVEDAGKVYAEVMKHEGEYEVEQN